MELVKIKELVVGPIATNCYIISCAEKSEALIVDPGGNPERIRSAISGERLTPTAIVLTHGHSDHMAAAAELMRDYGIGAALHGDDIETMQKSVEDAPMWGFGEIELPRIETLLSDGDTIRFGNRSLLVRHTPGHTLGGVSLLMEGKAFVGDTLFARSIGRTDFYGGDLETLLGSIRSVLFGLPDRTLVYCGHGPATEIGIEKRDNPFLNGYF